MLEEGLYEQLINRLLQKEISDDTKIVGKRNLSEESADRSLSRYIAQVAELGLNSCDDMKSRIALANQLIDIIRSRTGQDFLLDYIIPPENDDGTKDSVVEELLSVQERCNSAQAVAGGKAGIARPLSSLAESSLFTGSDKEPMMFSEPCPRS
ncbi:MAG: hypothetical protein IJ523_12560 [Succinivibrionaceae bacterium]|nr:hypothetical protein [Succinivibrionaceae bacterium]